MTIKRHILVLFRLVILYATITFLISFCSSGRGTASAQMNSEDGLYTVALGAYRNGFYDIAIGQFRKFLDLYPESHKAPFAWFRIGECYRAQKKAAPAQDAYQKVVELYPDHAVTYTALYYLAGIKFDRKDYTSALSDYQRLIKESSSKDLLQMTRFMLAETLYQLKRYTEALAAYQTFINESPGHELVYQAISGAGWCLMELKRYNEAVIQFQMLLSKNPPEDLAAQAHLKMAGALFEIKDYKGSVVHYETYSRLRPEDRHTIILRQGFALSKIGRDDEAVKVFQDFIKDNKTKDAPANSEAFFYLGQTLYKLQKYDDAISSFQSFIKKDSDHPMAIGAKYWMAQCYVKKGNIPLAKEFFKEVIETSPDVEIVYHASLDMGNLYYQQGQTQEAIDFYSKAAYSKDHSLAAEAGYRLAESFILMGDQEKAIREFQAIEAFHPHQSIWIQMGMFRLGNIYEQGGDTIRAISLYKKVAAMSEVTGDLAQAAMERIEVISRLLHDPNMGKTIQEKEAGDDKKTP
ncbi:tetratricopeptide repeat protein [bacterium]|nr:tetratricopeptide repeat protein [bacterium]